MLYALRNKKNLPFFIGFAGLVLLDASFSAYGLETLRYGSKPLIMLSLMAYFAAHRKKFSKVYYTLGLCAMGLSLAGDVFLMFNNILPEFFIAGLTAFLLAHIGYIILFVQQRNKLLGIRWLEAFSLIIFALFMGFLILPETGTLLVPVALYIIVIATMAYTVVLRKGRISQKSYISGYIGAILFLASDSLLALSLFKEGMPEVGFLIMLTYGMAQGCIAYSLVSATTAQYVRQ